MSKLIPYLAVFAGLVLCAIVIPSSVEALRIAADFDTFQSTRATVTSERAEKHSRGPATGHVEFEFTTPQGDTIEGDNAVTRILDSPERVDRLTERIKGVKWITVYYDPADPRRVVIHDVSVWPPLGMIAVTLLLLFGGVHAYVIDRRRRRLQERADAARRRGGAARTKRDTGPS